MHRFLVLIVLLTHTLVVAGETPKSVSVEKTRINTASSAAAATGSVLEVIRGASAVSVDGSGGIVNIISKKQSANMFNAMAAFNYGFNGFLNGNVAMSYNKGRWGVRFNYNGKYEKDLIESELHRQILATGTKVDQLIHATKRTSGQNAGLNLQFKATPKDILTADFKVALPRMNNFQDFNGTRQTDITFNRENFEGGLGYKHLFDPGKKELGVNASVSSNIGIRQSFLKNALTVSALLTDVFNTRRWDVHSDNPVFILVNNSKNRSRMFWLGINWNFHSFKAAKGTQKQQEEDRSILRLGD